jgi:hypothetical protein
MTVLSTAHTARKASGPSMMCLRGSHVICGFGSALQERELCFVEIMAMEGIASCLHITAHVLISQGTQNMVVLVIGCHQNCGPRCILWLQMLMSFEAWAVATNEK